MQLDEFLHKHRESYPIPDPIVLAALDLILAARARELATCTKGCRSVCARCGFQGQFVALTKEMRAEYNKGGTTYDCWPT